VLGAQQAVVPPGASVERPKWRISAGASTSWTSVDLPEPLTPVTQTRRCSGNLDRDVLQVVLAHALQHQARRVRRTSAGKPMPDLLAPAQVGAGQRVGAAQVLRACRRTRSARRAPGPRAHVDHAVGRQHHGRVVLDHHQRVAGIAQALHGLGDAVHVARVQADAGLVEHEQSVHQRGAQRRGQVDALHLAAGQRAALAVQTQVADADVAQVRRRVVISSNSSLSALFSAWSWAAGASVAAWPQLRAQPVEEAGAAGRSAAASGRAGTAPAGPRAARASRTRRWA
jgi:hypothetical protein